MKTVKPHGPVEPPNARIFHDACKKDGRDHGQGAFSGYSGKKNKKRLTFFLFSTFIVFD
jgi:hypothetical protein